MVIDEEHDTGPIVIREEEDDDETTDLADIPEAGGVTSDVRPVKRTGTQENLMHNSGGSGDSDDSFHIEAVPAKKRCRQAQREVDDKASEDDEKKRLALNTSYEGFSIYGRILCLVVKRKGIRAAGGAGAPGSQQMMENWVSTQAAAEQNDDDG